MMHCWGMKSETTVYHHANAFKLFALRNRSLQSALGNIVEQADSHHFTGSEILYAVRTLAHMSEVGRWISPTSKSEVIYSTQRFPAAQAALPASPNAQPILIASRPVLESDANH
jgi:hypothetical protein